MPINLFETLGKHLRRLLGYRVAKVVLRNSRDAGGTRYLAAVRQPGGDILIDGQDIGPAVEDALGVREYEWKWTIRAKDVPSLAQALGNPGDVLEALGERFSGNAAAGLYSFLEDSKVPFEKWTRRGD